MQSLVAGYKLASDLARRAVEHASARTGFCGMGLIQEEL